jgi:hypothetical protein
MLIRRFGIQLPDWARREHPMLRYELARNSTRTLPKSRQYLRALGVVLLGLLLLAAGYLRATDLLRQPAGQNLTEEVLAVVFWPLLIVQVVLRIAALVLTGGVISEEKRRQSWDNLRATESGAALTLRTRWASIFYRLRGLLGILIAARIALILGILIDLTAFQGRYLDLMINGIVPEIALPVAAVLVAFFMTASLLLPITGVGLDAAIGLLIATTLQQRTYSALAQIVLILARLVIIGALTYAATQFVNGELEATEVGSWLLMAGFAALGDWGLAFLNLGFFGEVWATVPYGIFIGLALLAFSMIQAALTDGILALAIRQAERRG